MTTLSLKLREENEFIPLKDFEDRYEIMIQLVLLIILLKKLVSIKQINNKRIVNEIKTSFEFLENPNHPDKEPYLPVFFFIIWRK